MRDFLKVVVVVVVLGGVAWYMATNPLGTEMPLYRMDCQGNEIAKVVRYSQEDHSQDVLAVYRLHSVNPVEAPDIVVKYSEWSDVSALSFTTERPYEELGAIQSCLDGWVTLKAKVHGNWRDISVCYADEPRCPSDSSQRIRGLS